jgi:hypothetical protein
METVYLLLAVTRLDLKVELDLAPISTQKTPMCLLCTDYP